MGILVTFSIFLSRGRMTHKEAHGYNNKCIYLEL